MSRFAASGTVALWLTASVLILVGAALIAGQISAEFSREFHQRLARELRAEGFVIETRPWTDDLRSTAMEGTNEAPSEQIVSISDIRSRHKWPAHVPFPAPPVVSVNLWHDLASLTSLRKLSLTHTPIPTEEFCRLDGSRNLQSLAIKVKPDARLGIAALAALPHLERLRLTGSLTDDVAALLVALNRLTSLSLNDTRISDLAIERLARSALSLKLTHIDVGGTNVTDDALRLIAEWPQIQWVGACRCPSVSDAGIAQLHRISSLKGLDIRDNPQLTIKSLESLTASTSLTTVLAARTSISKPDAIGIEGKPSVRFQLDLGSSYAGEH